MTSQRTSSTTFREDDSIYCQEHLYNFSQLRFSIYFTHPYSPVLPHLTYTNLQAFFRQIPAVAVPVPTRRQNLILVPTEYHFRYIIDRRRTPTPPLIPIEQDISFTHISTSIHSSDASIPDLEPISDLPPYSPSHENLPSYRETILRRIQGVEREFEEDRRRIIHERDQSIIQTQTNTEFQIANRLSDYREELRRLNSLLDL